MARQGTDRSAHAERGNDLYETPPEAVEALMRHAILPGPIWEPCAGRGAIARVLKKGGHTVTMHDVARYPGAMHGIKIRDFFTFTEPPAEVFPDALGAWPTIVTNPPYMNAVPFIRHCLFLNCDAWVLLRLAALEGDRKSDIMDGHLDRLLVGIERLPAMHREGWDGPKVDKATMPFAWFHFSPVSRKTGEWILTKRISWRS